MSSTSDWNPLAQECDVVVVGTGPGGATIGHGMAAAGRRVVFCELGMGPGGAPPVLGCYPELAEGRDGSVLDPRFDAALAARAGRCADTLIDASHPRQLAFVPFIGHGPGGSSALYGMALERLRPSDFEPGVPPADARESSAVASWPVSYAEMAPWYAKAEGLYRVRGEADPLAWGDGAAPSAQRPNLLPPTPVTAATAALSEALRARGLHPYRLPVGCDWLRDCRSCQGFLCHRPCKNDAARIGLHPAITEHGAKLLTGCRVLSVTMNGRRANGVRIVMRGQEHVIRAALVVVAAGALQSPLILLRSQLGNEHDQVGRNLMRHFIDLMQFKPLDRSSGELDNRHKELAFNDLYSDAGMRLGTVQSFGRLPPPTMLFGSLVDDVRSSSARALAPLLKPIRPLLLPLLRRIEGSYLNLASIVEDLPYAEHRVTPVPDDPTAAVLHYTMKPEAVSRVGHMRRRLRGLLKGMPYKLLAQAHNNHRIAHVCGTCRFGDDPRTSVLDRFNRVHTVEGLHVVDASFFPSSGGTNPTLTIVANALRVADHLITHH